MQGSNRRRSSPITAPRAGQAAKCRNRYDEYVVSRSRVRVFARWWFAVLTSIAACAHAPVDRERALRSGETVIHLRYAVTNTEDAERVERALETAAPLAERWGLLPEMVTITIHPTHDALEAASRVRGVDWMRAWARLDTIELQAPRTWTPGTANTRDLTQLLAHELTHCVMYEAIGGERVALGVPAWFREGMATAAAGQRFVAPVRADALAATVAFSGDEAPLAYVVANEAFLALERRYGIERIRAVLARVRVGSSFAIAFHEELGIALSAFESEFLVAVPPRAG